MSMYEYGTGQQGLNYPNPYKFENYMLSIKVLIFTIASIYMLFLSRDNLQERNIFALIITITGTIAFLFFALRSAFIITKQLRVYFGRGQPASLAPEINPNGFGGTDEVKKLKETIRQGAIYVETPPGNLNGFLYTQFKDLIIAPKEIQALFQHCFGNIVKMITLFIVFIVSAFLASGTNLNGWLGVLYSAVAIILILIPLFQKNINDVSLNLSKFWVLLGVSLSMTIALVLFKEQLPNVSKYNFGWQTIVITMMAIIGEFAILRALYFQLEKPIGLTTAYHQEAISFNANPNQLTLEAERKLQESWVMQVPHRIYSRFHPYLKPENKTGSFNFQIIQESQPVAPKALQDGLTLETILSDNRKKHIFFVNILAVVVSLISTIGLAYVATKSQNLKTLQYETISWTPLLIAALSLSMYWMKVMHGLWGRFDFESILYIVESEGNYVTSQINFGNQFHDKLQANKDVISCDHVTIRVWITHLKTSVFGHGMTAENGGLNPRRIIFMTGLKDQSIAWVQHIKDFASKQSMLVSPTSQQDLERMSQLSQLNSLSKNFENNKMLDTDNLNNEQIPKIKDERLEDYINENKND